MVFAMKRVELGRKRRLTAPSILVFFTDPLGVTDIGGTLAKHSKAGAKVVSVILWEYPDEVLKQIRKMASILQIETRVLGYKRGEVFADLPTKKRIVKIIREVRPDIAITFDPEFAANTTYGDHLVTHQLMMDVLGLCYRENFAPEQLKEGLETWFVKAVYYPFWGLRGRPDIIVDVTETFDLKVKATLALEGQYQLTGKILPIFYTEDALEAVLPTYRRMKADLKKVGKEWQRERRRATARFIGDQADAAFGEAFKRTEPLKLDYLTT
jgi:LmbE family N-acetylglucosaminyl deacetylase